MKTRLSSILTFYYKVICPIAGSVILILVNVENPSFIKLALSFVLFWTPMSLLYYYTLAPLKKISIDENFLYISNYIKEVRIPLSFIKHVDSGYGLMRAPRYKVVLTLRHSCEFGTRLRFVPRFPINKTVGILIARNSVTWSKSSKKG